MKKSSDSFPAGKYENSEVTRRLYRGALEATRLLEDHLRSSLSPDFIFGIEVTYLRMRLKDYCERLMFSDPIEYGNKAEELMWRKVYYTVLQLHKQQAKKAQSHQHDYDLESCLLAGIGNYHHLLLRLQAEFHLNLEGKVDSPFLWQQRGIKKERWKKHRRSVETEKETKEWAELMCHRFLICLGDLSRYMYEAGDAQSGLISERFYRQAFCLNPSLGIPLNQLATLSGLRNYGCDALYYYMRCALSPQPFDAVEGNLSRLFDKNSEAFQELDTSETKERSVVSRRLYLRFIKLSEHFYLQKDENLQQLCQDVLKDFDLSLTLEMEEGLGDADRILSFKVAVVALSLFSRLQQQGSPMVSAAAAFTLTLLSHVLRHTLKRLSLELYGHGDLDAKRFEEETETRNTSGTITPSHTPIEMNHQNGFGQPENQEAKSQGRSLSKKRLNRLRKARRRRNCSVNSQEDSEVSEGEPAALTSSSDIENEEEDKWSSDELNLVNSDISETGSCSSFDDQVDSDATDQEEDEEEREMNGTVPDQPLAIELNGEGGRNGSEELRTTDESRPLKATIKGTGRDVCEALAKEPLLVVVKVLSDWLKTNLDIVKACAESSKPLWFRLVDLLNILVKAESKFLLVKEPQLGIFLSMRRKRVNQKVNWFQPQPLPEDLELQKLPPLVKAHNIIPGLLNGKQGKGGSKMEEVYLRLQCLLHFGLVLCDCLQTGIAFDFDNDHFELLSLQMKLSKPFTQSLSSGRATPGSPDGTAPVDVDSQRKQMMRNMAHLWLKSEVNDLEVETGRAASPYNMSPYLVPDTSALCQQLGALKRLESAKRFILILPSVVISNLDYLKRDSQGAREAIRWIETELRRGSRFLRAQKPHERTSLVPIKYPKKKDKEAWDFFQVLECCNYLSRCNSTTKEGAAPLVTLLTGGRQLPLTSSAAIARSAGINMEGVEEFSARWKGTAKSQGQG